MSRPRRQSKPEFSINEKDFKNSGIFRLLEIETGRSGPSTLIDHMQSAEMTRTSLSKTAKVRNSLGPNNQATAHEILAARRDSLNSSSSQRASSCSNSAVLILMEDLVAANAAVLASRDVRGRLHHCPDRLILGV